MTLARTDVLLVAPSGSRWSVMNRQRETLACFGTEEEAVAYAGLRARNHPVERLQILDADGTVAVEDWLMPARGASRR